MSARARPVYDHWRDTEGTHIPNGCRVEQVEVAKEHGALTSRLGKQGAVVSRAPKGNRLRVRFDDEPSLLVGVRPHLLRVVPDVVVDTPALSVEQIVADLETLRALLPPGPAWRRGRDDASSL